MLTITSNFCNFKDRQGEYYTRDDLELLSKNVITCDIINFKNNGKTGYGFTANIAKQVMTKVTAPKYGKIIIINDLSLHMLNELLDAGYKLENIYMAYGKWNKRAEPDDNEIAYNIMVEYIKANFKEKINIIKLKEIFNMKGTKIDLIIANPPYKAIGANITKHIIDNIDFNEYINLLPANDYKKNTTHDLFNYQSNMVCITKTNTTESTDRFGDAAVTTHLAKIYKTKINNLTMDEFERSQYIDKTLDKYFEENSKRQHYAIDKMPTGGYLRKTAGIWDINTTFIIGMRDMNHKHLPYSKTCITYQWNVKNTGSMDSLPAMTNNTQLSVSNCNFKTEIEKKNFVNFIYTNFKLFSKIFTALNCDGTVHSIAFPKVDWTRSWTVEEILEDYGYTKAEIKEVMDDLVNFKGMDD